MVQCTFKFKKTVYSFHYIHIQCIVLFYMYCSSEAKQILTTKKVMFSKFEKMH